MGRFSWLGGNTDAKADTQSVRRARAHRRSIPTAADAGEAWERADRQRFGPNPFYRRGR